MGCSTVKINASLASVVEEVKLANTKQLKAKPQADKRVRKDQNAKDIRENAEGRNPTMNNCIIGIPTIVTL